MATHPHVPAPDVYLADPACSWGCDHCEVMCATLAVIAGNLERELDAMMTGLPPVPSAAQQAALVAKAERLQAYSSALDETRASRAEARGHTRRAAEPGRGVTRRVPGLAGHSLH